MQDSAKTSKTARTVLIVLVTLIVGGAITYPFAHMMGKDSVNQTASTSMSTSTTTKAADLRATLNNLLREHVTTNLTVSYNIIDNAPDAKLQASLDAQTANAVAIATAVGSVYGDEAETAVTAPFVEHLTQSNNYAKAVHAGDTAAEATSLTALQASLRDVANVFNSVIPSLSSDTLYSALNDHETLMNKVAMAYQAGDYAMAYQLEAEALTQISGGADAIAGGIVTAKPELFK